MEAVDWQMNKAPLECAKYMLENQVNCDINFKVGDEEEIIEAHKLILTMRSPVFDRMFNGSFCEPETDPSIPDVSPAAFRTLLRYCYYECLDVDADTAVMVHYAATKYMLPILETAARKTLTTNIDCTSIWDVCKYSTVVGDKQLQFSCSEYFKKNLSESIVLDVIRYAVSVNDKDLKTCCKKYLKEHLCVSNIWDIYKYAFNEGDREVHQLCKAFFEKDIASVREALQSKEFLTMSQQMLTDVLHINDKSDKTTMLNYKGETTPGISAPEVELFNACNAWAEAECQRWEIAPTGANKREVLRECLFLIRFPCILQKDLSNIVYPTGILTQTEMVKLGQYMNRHPGTACQVDFPSDRRHFVVRPTGAASDGSTGAVYIESDVRVMLSRLWTWEPGMYSVTMRNERSLRSRSMLLSTKHDNHLIGDHSNYILPYIDIEPPQVLEAGSSYSVTAELTQDGTLMDKEPRVEYIRLQGDSSPYKEVKITRDRNTNNHKIYSLTLSLV